MFRRLLLSFSLVLIFVSSPLHAAVTLTFYSKELGNSFPHAFIELSGTTGPQQVPVQSTVGFTAKHISPAILTGSVEGEVQPVTDGYKRGSNRHFSILLTDDQYARVAAEVERWRTMPGKSYNLNKRNCVFFVGDVAKAAGLIVVENPKLMKKPRSFTQSIMEMNPWVASADPAAPPMVMAVAPTASATAQ
ncbi:MAG: hypothetical protein H0W74_02380 [Sphingosinicella sp.]|nr:hypothetical protein [Sphingosinicella sp.]